MASNDTSFKPGVSGNPSGRKPDKALREMCRALTSDAVDALKIALADPKTAVPAAVAILNRGWGMPAQAIAVSTDAFSEMTLEHLIALATVAERLISEDAVDPAEGGDVPPGVGAID